MEKRYEQEQERSKPIIGRICSLDLPSDTVDIKKHVLRPVIPLDHIFIEDPVRMLRAVKYSATTHAQMSFLLRRKIRQSANLLSQVSPSRLTEEMMKIINGGHSFDIIKEAIDLDLFMYLQPAAASMIFDNKKIEKQYMENLKKLDELHVTETDSRLGKKLYFIIYDFICTLTDWKKEVQNKSSFSELYAKTWTECRNFVLPMNPQRKELEFAVKSVLSSFGIQIKKKPEKSKKKSSEK